MAAEVYLNDEEREKLRALLDQNAELLDKVCSHISIENHARCSEAVLEARNQAAAGYAGIAKAFETVVGIIAAEIDEQTNLAEAEMARLQEQSESEGTNGS